MAEANGAKPKVGVNKGNAGKGRPKGSPNKVTREFRETIRQLLEDNSENVGIWLNLVAYGDGSEHAKPDPGRALDLLGKLAEFASPKLNRTELAGDPEKPVRLEFGWKSAE